MLQQLIDRLISLYNRKAIAADDFTTKQLIESLAAFTQKTFMHDPSSTNTKQDNLTRYFSTLEPGKRDKIASASLQLLKAALTYSKNNEPIGGQSPIYEAAAILQSYWMPSIHGLTSHDSPYLVPVNHQQVPTQCLLMFLRDVKVVTMLWLLSEWDSSNSLDISEHEIKLQQTPFMLQYEHDQFLKEIISKALDLSTECCSEMVALLNSPKYLELKKTICFTLKINRPLTCDDLTSFLTRSNNSETMPISLFSLLISEHEKGFIELKYPDTVFYLGEKFYFLKKQILDTLGESTVTTLFCDYRDQLEKLNRALTDLLDVIQWAGIRLRKDAKLGFQYFSAILWWWQKLALANR